MRFDAIHPGPPLTPDALDAYCSERQIEVPDSLRQQLLEQNGGGARDDYHVRLPNGEVEVVSSFFGVGMPDLANELAWIADTFKGRTPPGMLAFADDPGGNLFLIGEDGAIWFWDHEMEGEPRAHVRVSESLDAFLAALRPDAE